MDISLKLKRAVATLSAVALLVSNASVAFAQTFNDVATNAWYYDYVEQLVDDGVVDAADNFRPNDSLNRAELVKMVITAVDGLSGYEAPATPTFDDVPTSAWFYDYVEAAVQLDIVGGYTDAAGNPTGKFGPGDTVNRAAATKILVNAFGVPTDLNPASKFSDVTSGAWYHDYVVTAYNQSILDGYANGKFGPSDPVTRAQVAKLVVNAQNPVERASSSEETPTPTSEGALEVSLNDETPASVTVPKSASNVKLLGIDVTAAEDDVAVTNLVITRGGVGNASDWANLYIYNGAERLTTGRTLNSDTNTATFPVNLTVDAGTTATLWLVGEMSATGGANNQHYFYVASASDVTSNAQSVAGDFPVAGNTFTTGGVTVNTVTVTTGTAIAQPLIGGMDQEISSFKITAGADNDVAIHQVALTQNGSLASSKLTNLKLLRGTDVVATAEGFDGDLVTFVLDTPFVIDEGQNKTFYVRADIDGGRTTDTVQIYLDENTDLVAIDQQYGFGAVVSNSTTTGFKPGAASPLVTATSLKGGEVTVTDNGPAATQIAQNTTNVQLLNFSITAGRDLRVKDMSLNVQIQNAAATGPTITSATALGTDTITAAAAGTTPQGTTASFCVVDTTAAAVGTTEFQVGDTVSIPTASGTAYEIITGIADNTGAAGTNCTSADDDIITTNAAAGIAVTYGGTVTEINPYTLLKNVKIVDLDSGSTLQGPLTKASDGTLAAAAPSDYTKGFTEDYNLTGGETRHLSIQADIDQNMPDGYAIYAKIDYQTLAGSVKDDAANENIAGADIVGGILTGKTHTTANNSLTVAKASTPTTQTYVKGDDQVPSLGLAMTAGDAGDITVKKIIVRAYATDSTTDGAGAAATAGVQGWEGTTAGTGGWEDAEGNIAANTLVSSITLYDGNNVVAGPKSISLVDVTGGTYTAGTDYYKATFDNLNIVVPKGGTKTLTAKVKLLNSATGTNYLSLDIAPASEITAEDKEANSITATSTTTNLNLVADPTAPSPLITILASGTLSASSEGNPDAANVVAGKTMQLVSKYRFNALREGFTVNKLTIINDVAGVFGDVAAVDTNAVKNVVLKYPDINGVMQTKSASLSGGSATISNLGFYIAKGSDAYIEIYADVSAMTDVGATLSGKTIRLGIRDTGNSITTLEAVGASSSTTVDTDAELDVTNETAVNNFVVRKTIPTFAKVSGLGTTLTAGENRIYGFTISADAAGAAGIARLSVTVANSTTGTLGSFKLYRGSTLLSAAIGTGTANINQGAADLTAAGTIAIGATQDAIISFNTTEETIAAGQSQTYYLDATASAAAAGDSVNTKLAVGDESVAVTGLTDNNGNGAANTGELIGAGNLYATQAAYRTTTAAGRAHAWSDKSADNHVFDGAASAGSADYTNGYLLKLTSVSSHGMSK